MTNRKETVRNVRCTYHRPHTDAVAGAAAFRAMFARIGEISGATCSLEEEVDSRDYAAMVDAVRSGIEKNVQRASAEYAAGYLYALAYVLCLNADGCGIRPEDDASWDSIVETAGALSTRHGDREGTAKKAAVTPIPIDLMNVAFDAVYKIDALTKALLGIGPMISAERDLVTDELVERIGQLNLAVMSVLENDSSAADAHEPG